MRIPNGYTVKARFQFRGLRSSILQILSLLIALPLLLLFSNLTKTIHSDFDLNAFLSKFDTVGMTLILGMGLLFFLYVHSYLHEKIHQKSIGIFIGQEPTLHMNLPVRNVTLPVGEVCTRKEAIIGLLSPLIILEILGFAILWLVSQNDVLPLVILFLSINVGMAAVDIAEAVWLLRHPSNYYFGFDGKDSVLYGP